MTEDLEAIYQNEELKEKALALHHQGMTAYEIGQSLHISPMVVQRWIRDMNLSVPHSCQCPHCGGTGKLIADLDLETPIRDDAGSPVYYCLACHRTFPLSEGRR